MVLVAIAGYCVGARPAKSQDRPSYALESRENEIYHDLLFSDRATEPEYYAFLGQSWVFNRRMQWRQGPGRTLLCYSQGGDLVLTAADGPSEWFSEPANEVKSKEDGRLRFTKRSKRHRDCAVLPGFQFHLGQHPRLRVNVSEAAGAWQFCILIKGRSGPPCFATQWRSGPGEFTVDLQSLMRERGYTLNYPELTFAMGLWSALPGQEQTVEFSASLAASPCVVACLPVIRSVEAAREGVPITAIVLDATGQTLSESAVRVTATVGEAAWPMAETEGIWTARLPGLPVGDHAVKLEVSGAVEAEGSVALRINDGRFLAYDATRSSLVKAGCPLGPLSGSFQGMVHFIDAGKPEERLVQGQSAYDALSRQAQNKAPWHYWEALTEPELDARFGFLAKNGWRLLHLCQHWGSWEKLDAGGRIAPHGAEQAALYYRMAARHGLAVVQALSHYPYGSKFTIPYRQYLEAGFRDEDWKNVASAFTERFHGYLADYATLFREESAIAALTTSGEGDIAAGPDRVNDTHAFMIENMPNHLFVSEPVHRMTALPTEHARGWNQGLFGSRLYWIGDDVAPDIDLGIECKFMQLGPCFMAEGSWPCPRLYAGVSGRGNSWEGTPEYRIRLRDSLCLGLVYRFPMLLTWEEQWAEDEHSLVEQIRTQVDWSKPFLQAPVALRVGSEHVREKRAVLAAYEDAFSSRPLATCYLPPGTPVPEGVLAVLEAGAEFRAPAFVSEGGTIPDEVQNRMPLTLSKGYRGAYGWSTDRTMCIAYLWNSGGHQEKDYTSCLGGRRHRTAKPAEFAVQLHRFPAMPLVARLYDAATKQLVKTQSFSGAATFKVADTASDYLLLVTADRHGIGSGDER